MSDKLKADKVCVIGAGCAGLSAAKALCDQGIDYDQFEAQADIGGNWAFGIYDGAHLISSRKTSGFLDYPMPDHLPDFPSRDQVQAYLQDYASRFGLKDRVTLNTQVVSVVPVKVDACTKWDVTLHNGQTQRYHSVVVANGHLWDPVVPEFEGEFTGKQIHSRNYRHVGDLQGSGILVVGSGNSGCDLVAEAAFAGKQVTLSMRQGRWFLPKTMFGVPRGDLFIEQLPASQKEAVLSSLVNVILGNITERGLPAPDHAFLEKPPTINSLIFHLLEHGRVAIAPGIERIDAKTVRFTDATAKQIDTIVWATGYRTTFPFLDETIFQWENGVPLRFAGGTMSLGAPGLYFNGLASPRGANLPMHSACAQLIAQCIQTHQVLGDPLFASLAQHSKSVALMDGNVQDIIGQANAIKERCIQMRLA